MPATALATKAAPTLPPSPPRVPLRAVPPPPATVGDRIVETLRRFPDRDLTTAEIAKAIDKTPDAVRKVLCKLVNADRVVRAAEGVFRLPGCEDRPVAPRAPRVRPDAAAVPAKAREPGKWMTLADERKVALRARAGDRDAAGQLVVSVRPFVHRKVNEVAAYLARARVRLCRADLDDMAGECELDLLRCAVPRFDPTRGVRFLTYAGWWVLASIRRWLQNNRRTVRVPVWLQEKRGQERRIGADTGTFQGAQLSGLTAPGSALSLDVLVGGGAYEGRETTFLDRLVDPAVGAEAAVAAREMEERLRRAVDRLHPRKRDIVLRRFGIGRDDEETLKTVAQHHQLSRERVRQLENQAIGELRALLEADEAAA